MNIVQFKGGLGNQMFQYALYKALILEGNAKVRADVSFYSEHSEDCSFELDKVFPQICMKNDKHNRLLKKRNLYLKLRKNREWVAHFNYNILPFCIYFKEKEDGMYDERVFKLRNAALSGYWQTEKYFRKIRNALLKDFTFSYGEDNLEMLRNRFLNDKESVAIHIRRGDYLNHTEIFGNLSESQYYRMAINSIKKRIKDPHLVFFSNDIETVKERYPYKGAVYIEGCMFENYHSWYDMCLMSCCSHNIIANSTFSWWGAWLNQNKNKIVIAPKKWFFDGKSGKDICPDEWERIAAE